MNTKTFADRIGIKPESIHRRTCLTGSYFGVKPTPLPSGRLLWPDDAVEQLIAQRKPSAKEVSHATA